MASLRPMLGRLWTGRFESDQAGSRHLGQFMQFDRFRPVFAIRDRSAESSKLPLQQNRQ